MTDEDKAPYVAKAQETRLKWEKELQIYKHELKNGVSLLQYKAHKFSLLGGSAYFKLQKSQKFIIDI